jgi:L-alanine-DL-glutamate epimerase-like enolase superfamily enzyme
MRDDGPAVREITAAVYVIPTDAPEADGTFAWDKTTMVVASVRAGVARGIGWTYAAAAAQSVIADVLASAVTGRSALDLPGAAEAMARTVRNIGRPGIAATAISAVDIALWDLKARLLGCPLAWMLGQARDSVPVYGSDGFTSYDDGQTCEQLAAWVEKVREKRDDVGKDDDIGKKFHLEFTSRLPLRASRGRAQGHLRQRVPGGHYGS